MAVETLDYTAAPESDPHAADEGTTRGALTLDDAAYDGSALAELTALRQAGYQLMWSVRAINTVAAESGQCQALAIAVVVRYPTVGEGYRSLVHVVVKANPARLADYIRGHWAIENGLHGCGM